MKGSDNMNVLTNLIFVLVDVLESNLMDCQAIYKKNGYELKHETKRNFNTAIAAIKRLKSDVNKMRMSSQIAFGNDADIMNAFIKILIDRTGDDDIMAFKFYNYIKQFPSRLNLNLDGLEDAFMAAIESSKEESDEQSKR